MVVVGGLKEMVRLRVAIVETILNFIATDRTEVEDLYG
jgi:hypothetical protein